MKRFLAVITLCALSGAVHAGQTLPLKDLVAENGKRIQQVKNGMTRADVLRVMTDDVAQIPGGEVGNPYKARTLQKGGANYEVLYYVTQEPTRERNAMTTPVVLKNGVVSGLGDESVRALAQ